MMDPMNGNMFLLANITSPGNDTTAERHSKSLTLGRDDQHRATSNFDEGLEIFIKEEMKSSRHTLDESSRKPSTDSELRPSEDPNKNK